jgi:methyl-accepting chemotaxis protein
MMGLRKDPKFDEELKKFKEQTGGVKLSGLTDKFKSGIKSARDNVKSRISSATDKIPATSDTSVSLAPPMELDSEDWMGPRIRWFLAAVTSPYARVMLRGLFVVIFFISYLESIPVFGNILSVGLDIMVTGGKIITKSVQKQIPFVMGLIPLPYAGLVGLMMAAIYGAMVWPIIAMVSVSRQEFTVAMESFLRVIPPPAGDMIADLFLESNRFVAKMDLKRRKLASSIASAIGTIASLLENVGAKISEGVSDVSARIGKISQMKNEAIDKVKQINTDTFGNVGDQLKNVRDFGANSSLQDAFSNIKQSPPTTKEISANLREFSNKIQESANVQPAPTGQGRNPLSTRRRGSSKWMKTLRTKSVRH